MADKDILIKLDANTARLVKGIRQSKKEMRSLKRSVYSAKKSLKSFVVAAGGLYLAKQAFDGVASAAKSMIDNSSQFEQYSNRMSAFTTSTMETNSEMARAEQFAIRYRQQIAKTTETLLLMKNYGLDDSIESMKVYGNTAIGSGKSINQFAEAMADALTGENERLKEFGVKAAVLGEQVGYAWTDSSGKARNIIVANNKDVIDSTLIAIFNEKYIGQMEKYKSSFKGIIQGIKNIWTKFSTSLGGTDLFSWVKGAAEYVSEAFSVALSGVNADNFSSSVVGGFESIITTIGYAAEAVTLFKLGLATIQTTFATAGYYITLGFQAIADAGAASTNAILQTWVDLTNKMGSAWHGFVTWVKQTWNDFIGGIADSSFGKFATDNFGIDFGKLKGEITPFTAKVLELKAVGKDFSKEITYWGDAMNEGFKSAQNLNDQIGKGNQRARDAIAKIRENAKNIAGDEKAANTEREKAKKLLDELGAKYGALNKNGGKPKGGKGGGGGSKGGKSIADKAKADLKAAEKEAKKFAGTFSSLISGVLDGDISKAFQSFFKSIGSTMMKPFVDNMSDQLSAMLSKFSKGLGDFGGFAAGLGISLLGSAISSLFSNEVSQAEIDAAKGQVDFTDDSINSLASAYESVMYPMTKINQDMRRYLRNMDANFYSVARAMGASATSGGIDLTGANFVETEDTGFLGFSSKSISLIGTGLKFAVMDLGEAMNSAELDVQSYTTSLVKKSSFWGLFKSSSIKETYKDLPPEVIDDMAGAFANGYEAILTSGVALGLNQTNLQSALESAKIDLGKIDFTGLSQEEIASRLSQAYSTAFSGVVDGIGELAKYTDRYAQSNEAALETLGRLALEVDQSTHMFNMLGTTFQTLGDYTAQMQQLDIVAATGGIQQFGDAMSAYMGNFFTEAEQAAFQTTSMTEAFAKFGQTLPKTKDAYKDLLNSYDRTTEEGNRLYGQTLLLADGLSQMMDAGDRLRESTLKTVRDFTGNIADLWIGSLSFLNEGQKLQFANDAYYSRDLGVSALELAKNRAGLAMNTSATKEDYIPYFRDLVAEQKKANREDIPKEQLASLKRQENKLDAIAARIETLEQTTRNVS